MNTTDIEIAIADIFNPRVNIIVPNVSWGLGLHECDVLILTKSGYAYEVEIKISRADLKKDLNKAHMHKSNRIRGLWFALPQQLLKHMNLIPSNAGIISVSSPEADAFYPKFERRPTLNIDAKQFTREEIVKLIHLASMRIWPMKKRLRERCWEIEKLQKNLPILRP